jgi:hypothetical protein
MTKKYRLNLKVLLIFTLYSSFIILNSCECPLQETDIYQKCQVREATITRFSPTGNLVQVTNPDGTKQIVFQPDSLYSIHTFLFPFDKNMSGALVNDERFSKSSSIPIVKRPFSDKRPYFLAIFDNYPPNNDLNGDILLYSVADNFQSAEIRVAGDIVLTGLMFNSENSQEFCKLVDNLTKDTARIRSLKSSLSQFGINLPNSRVIDYNQSNLVVLDTGNQVVTGVTPPQNDIDEALKLVKNRAVNITVKLGEVYLYRAINGKYFIFAITDIREGTLSPYKRRLTIMFSEI